MHSKDEKLNGKLQQKKHKRTEKDNMGRAIEDSVYLRDEKFDKRKISWKKAIIGELRVE